MCSNNIDIEDIVNEQHSPSGCGSESFDDDDVHTVTKNSTKVDPEKLESFMKDFVSEGHNAGSKKQLEKLYIVIRRRHRINPSKQEMRTYFYQHFKRSNVNQIFRRYMVKKSMRSASGVKVVTVVLPGGKFSCAKDCHYCPQETDRQGNHTQPRSYLSSEPAMRRALRHRFDIRGQFWDRIQCYIATGNIDISDNSSEKMEVILSGGTWECYPLDERERFIRECYWAANTYGLKEDRKILSLKEEIKINETADYRIIGLTIETRPDFINRTSIRNYCRYGVTRVQIGVQHYDDDVLKKINRDCYTKDTIKAIRLLKQAGFKIVVHLMPDLPGSSPELDKWMFEVAIHNPDLQFDDVKIYPTAICRSHNDKYVVTSKIAEWYDNGEFQPYAEKNIEDLIDVIKHYFVNMNAWVRVQRCVRDIPGSSILAGYQSKTNLRQMIQERIDGSKEKTHDIRHMEVKESKYLKYPARLVVLKYPASEGTEYHLMMAAFEDSLVDKIEYYLFRFWSFLCSFFFFKKEELYWSNLTNYVACFGFLRLRIDPNPGGNIIKEIKNSALIREVHVYGNTLGVGSDRLSSQHRGYGQYMMSVAEDIALANGYHKTSVIAGVGTREYYKNKCGYNIGEIEGTYMVKNLNDNRFTNFLMRISILVTIISVIKYII